jgi:hypothetical protein
MFVAVSFHLFMKQMTFHPFRLQMKYSGHELKICALWFGSTDAFADIRKR